MVKSTAHRWSLLLLIGTTLIWGTTFPLIKDVVATLSPPMLIGSRFVIAALAFAPFYRQYNRRLLWDGSILGVVLFASYVTQVKGLELTSANQSAFITSLNVMLVPLLGIAIGRGISTKHFWAAGLALAGVGILSWEGAGLGLGDLWTLGCALAYAIYILLMEAITPKYPARDLTVVQLATIALLGILWALPDLPGQLSAIQAHWGAIVYLGLIATAVTTWTQVIAQRHLSATEAAIVYTLEPVFASMFSFWWLGEKLGGQGLLGAGMVVAAMLLSQIEGKKQKAGGRGQKDEAGGWREREEAEAERIKKRKEGGRK